MDFDAAFEKLIGHEGGLGAQRCGHLLESLTSTNAQLDGVAAASPQRSPLSDGSAGAIENKAARRAQVVRLLQGRRPSTVSGFVASIVVDAVDRHANRALAHFSEKRTEVVSPCITDRDPPAAPQRVARVARIQASILHVGPNSVGARRAQAVRQSSFRSALSLQASTRLSVPVHQLGADHLDLSAAFTKASPKPAAPRRNTRGEFQNDQSAKAFARNLKRCSHDV